MVVTVVPVPAEATHDLRSRILRQGGDDFVFPDDDDRVTVHLAALGDDGRIVGVASLYRRDDGWQLRGMAVDDDVQGTGVGRALLEAVHERFRGEHLWANCRDTAVGFYERMGWRIVGEGYDLVGMPHHRGEIDP